MKPLMSSSVRTRRMNRIAAYKIASLQAQINAQNVIIAAKDRLIAQYQRDAVRDADLIDLMVNQIRDQQQHPTLPDHVEFGWLRQTDMDRDVASRELTRRWAEGWRIYDLAYSPTGRDVTLWRPLPPSPAPLTRSARRTTSASIMATPAPATRIRVQHGTSNISPVPVIVNHFEGEPEDFDLEAFVRSRDRRMAQRALTALHGFSRAPFFSAEIYRSLGI